VNWVHFGINRQHGQAKRHHFELLHRKAPLIQAAAGTKTKSHLGGSNSKNKMSGRKIKPNSIGKDRQWQGQYVSERKKDALKTTKESKSLFVSYFGSYRRSFKTSKG